VTGAVHEQQPLRLVRATVQRGAHRRRHDPVGLAVDDEERRANARQLCRDVEALAQQPLDRKQPRDPPAAEELPQRRGRALDDDAGDGRIAGRELEGDRRAERVAVNELARGLGLEPQEVLPRGLGVLDHGRLGERSAVAAAEATVVDHQHRGAGVVQRGRHVHQAPDRAAGAVQKQDDRRALVLRYPPAVDERAASADLQPDVDVREPDGSGCPRRFPLRKVDEPVRKSPNDERRCQIEEEESGHHPERRASDRSRHAGERTPCSGRTRAALGGRREPRSPAPQCRAEVAAVVKKDEPPDSENVLPLGPDAVVFDAQAMTAVERRWCVRQ
jgi:hypothetical protein